MNPPSVASDGPRSSSPTDLPAEDLPAAHHTVDQSRIGAVPVFSGTEQDGPAEVTLSFRVGEADERLGTHGRCRLLERLVSPESLPEGVHCESAVTTLRTRFTVTGPDDAVGATLTGIARSVATLRTDRVDGIISELLGTWQPLERWDTTLMALRFGSRGYGLGAFPLLGLKYPDIAGFTEWARTWFTADNAVVSANRPPPASLDLGALGEGTRKVLPDPHQIDRRFPVMATGPEGMLALSFLTANDATTEMASQLLFDRVRKRLAAIDPHIERPTVVNRHTGTGLATIGVAIRAPEERLVDIHASISAELFGFGMNGPTDDELDEARLTLRRTRTAGSRAMVEREAKAALFGETFDHSAALTASPAACARAVRELATSLIWLVPADVDIPDRRLVRIVPGSAPVTEGQTYLVAPEIVGPDGPAKLVAGSQGVTVHQGNGASLTVAFADAVALEHLPDGSRVLWGDDGTRLHLQPAMWPGGDQLVAWIDQCVDPWVNLGNPAQSAPPTGAPPG